MPTLDLRQSRLTTLAKTWQDDFSKLYGASWPTQYCSWDLETTGFSESSDLIVEVGHCLVNDGRCVQRSSWLLDWTKDRTIDQDWLEYRLKTLKIKMAETGKNYRITYDRLRKEGKPPGAVLRFYHKLFETIRENGGFWIGQNLLSFDEKIFNAALRDFCNLSWRFGPNEVWDVGAWEKAAECKLQPNANEPPSQFFRRSARHRAPGVKWSIGHCLEKHGLAGKVPADQLHGASDDAYACHLLFEEQRKLLNA